MYGLALCLRNSFVVPSPTKLCMGDEPSFDEFSESDVDEWRIEFEDNQDRITTLAYIAWQASKDDEATVVEL